MTSPIRNTLKRHPSTPSLTSKLCKNQSNFDFSQRKKMRSSFIEQSAKTVMTRKKIIPVMDVI